MTSYLPESLDTIKETEAVPAGTYELQITDATEEVSGEHSKHPGSPMILVSLAFTDLSLNALSIKHYISLPYGEDDENREFKLLLLKRFIKCFNISYIKNLADLIFKFFGATANVAVDLSEPNENGNIYNNLKLPRIKRKVFEDPR